MGIFGPSIGDKRENGQCGPCKGSGVMGADGHCYLCDGTGKKQEEYKKCFLCKGSGKENGGVCSMCSGKGTRWG